MISLKKKGKRLLAATLAVLMLGTVVYRQEIVRAFDLNVFWIHPYVYPTWDGVTPEAWLDASFHAFSSQSSFIRSFLYQIVLCQSGVPNSSRQYSFPISY